MKLFLFLISSLCFAEVPYEISLLDAPYNFISNSAYPSMEQSLQVTKDYYNLTHLGIEKIFGNKKPYQRFLSQMSITTFDLISFYLPFSNSWMHEEWHRSVMGRRRISSYDEIYKFNFGSNVIKVSRVSDEDLIKLKQEHPEDLVRLSEAGIESQYELNLAFEKDTFYHENPVFNVDLLWMNTISNISYLGECTSKSGDESTEESNKKEKHIKERDFTGLDCVAWVYDLFRPDESYEARGNHPYGEGINRYRKTSDLTAEERKYLNDQYKLSFLNLLDPFLFNFNQIPYGKYSNEIFWNLNIRHHLTSFGYSLELNYFFKNAFLNVYSSLKTYVNRVRIFEGLEIEALRLPFEAFGKDWNFTPRILIFSQPKNQEFKTKKESLGGLMSVRINWPVLKSLELFLEPEIKSKGWVAGNVYLDSAWATRLGFQGFL